MSREDLTQLFDETLKGEYEDDSPWEAVRKLRQLGTRDVFEVAKTWCDSEDPLKRARAIDVLAQLGETVEHPTNSFPEDSYSLVEALASSEQEICPLSSAIAALGHLDDPRAVPLIARFSSHPSAEVRFSVACALGSFPNEALSVETLLTLMGDRDAEVRDWATFGLGVLGDTDSPTVRDALVGAVRDSDADVREEALVGLAKRHDKQAAAPLLAALKEPPVTERVIEAAYTLLGMERDREDWTLNDYAKALNERFSGTVME